jgi:hypothetical protein
MVRSGAGKIQSPTFIVEPQILTCLQLLMLNSSAGIREIFHRLNGTADTHHDEEEVTEEELIEGSYGDCSDSTVYDEFGRHRDCSYQALKSSTKDQCSLRLLQ